MKRILSAILGSAMICVIAGQAEAFTSLDAPETVPVGSATVTSTATLDVPVVVTQGSPTDAAGTINFGSGGNTFRDSGAALRVTLTTNAALNRLIIYTVNLDAGAVPQFCQNTALGNDGGGLVGTPTVAFPDACELTVPLVWAVRDTNVDYTFTPDTTTPSSIGATNGVFITDRAHVRTFTTVNSVLDNLATRFCSPTATHPVAPTNTASDGLYPQYFGQAGTALDICRLSDNTEIVEAQELSKNIAVVAFGFSGGNGTAPDVTTPSVLDTIPVASPIYIPVAADFRFATGGVTYGTNRLRVELVSQ